MAEEHNTNHDVQSNGGQSGVAPSYLLWVFIVGGIAVVGLLLASIYWPNLTERTKFFTGNLLNLIIGLAVIAQVLIYRKQWDSMREQVRIMGVAFDPCHDLRMAPFHSESIFSSKVYSDVELYVFSVGGSLVNDRYNKYRLFPNLKIFHSYIRNAEARFPLDRNSITLCRGEALLPQERIDAFNQSDPIKVSGYFKFAGAEQKDFCYRYYPWKGKRPEGVSQFIPCDFDPRLTTVITPETARLKLTGHSANLVHGKVEKKENA